MRFDDRIALVTGAGTGIGRAIAASLAAEGAHVHVTDVDLVRAEEVAAEIEATAGSADASAVDVTRAADVAAVLDRIGARHRRLDILVNNAGVNVRADFRHLTDAQWQSVRETNLDSVVRLCRDAFELLAASGRGSILNLSSIMAARALRQLAAYSATKAALTALSRALAVEYAPFGIRVNYLTPGFIDTALTSRVLRNPAISKALLERTPARRFGTPDDVARAALFLLSDDAAFITGAGLAVDGGMAAGL